MLIEVVLGHAPSEVVANQAGDMAVRRLNAPTK